jgi:hypothetical protein
MGRAMFTGYIAQIFVPSQVVGLLPVDMNYFKSGML